LKKFKSLFEGSDPDRYLDESVGNSREATGSVDTDVGTIAGNHTDQPVVDAESRLSEKPVVGRGLKRKYDVDDGTDIQIDVENSISTAKRQAIENMNATEPTGANHESAPKYDGIKAKSSVPSGNLDIDEAFLEAVASTRRRKEREDTYDREFNNLRISKPDLQQEKDWAVLESFGNDKDLRGNFMVVKEVDVFKDMVFRNGILDGRLEPNFKKFKKVSLIVVPKPQ